MVSAPEVRQNVICIACGLKPDDPLDHLCNPEQVKGFHLYLIQKHGAKLTDLMARILAPKVRTVAWP